MPQVILTLFQHLVPRILDLPPHPVTCTSKINFDRKIGKPSNNLQVKIRLGNPDRKKVCSVTNLHLDLLVWCLEKVPKNSKNILPNGDLMVLPHVCKVKKITLTNPSPNFWFIQSIAEKHIAERRPGRRFTQCWMPVIWIWTCAKNSNSWAGQH